MTAFSYRDLVVWQAAMELSADVIRKTKSWPSEERYGLVQQVRRASVSVAANIAEGHARASGREFAHHLSISRGSLAELETQIILAERIGYLECSESDELLEKAGHVSRMLVGLQKSILRRVAKVRG